MTRIRLLLSLSIIVALSADASAQFFPVLPVPTVGQNGIAFRFGGRNLRVEGFVTLGPPYPVIVPVTPTPFGFRPTGPAFLPYGYGYSPIAPGFPFPGYGVIEQRTTIQIINPPGLGARAGLREIPDLSGVDLDVDGPEKIWGKPDIQLAAAQKKAELAKVVPPPEKKQVVVAPAKPEAPKKIAPIPDGQKFVELGLTAFTTGEFGVAQLRFRQAAETIPPGPRAVFLHGQACIAVGKYREAAQLIQAGLKANPNWPSSNFRPKAELYANQLDAWKDHLDALKAAQKADPKNADPLFLLGYLAWFDGERGAALDYFHRASGLTVEVAWNEAFLAAAKK